MKLLTGSEMARFADKYTHSHRASTADAGVGSAARQESATGGQTPAAEAEEVSSSTAPSPVSLTSSPTPASATPAAVDARTETSGPASALNPEWVVVFKASAPELVVVLVSSFECSVPKCWLIIMTVAYSIPSHLIRFDPITQIRSGFDLHNYLCACGLDKSSFYLRVCRVSHLRGKKRYPYNSSFDQFFSLVYSRVRISYKFRVFGFSCI